MRNVSLMLMLGTILYPWKGEAACVTPPSCEELGFTVEASKCSGSFLRCPWDLNKAACKETYSDNCANRTSVLAPFGCKVYWSDCPSKCKEAYSDNCANRTSVLAPFGCKVYWSDCSSKCKEAYSDNCHMRTAASCSLGCSLYWSDCSSKCKTCKTDNCANRTSVSTPYGCEKYFDDCSSKCEKAYADNCHKRADRDPLNGCLQYYADCDSKCEIAATPLPVLYEDGTIINGYGPGSPIGIVFDEANKLAVALIDINEDGKLTYSSRDDKMVWSNAQYDLPSMTNCEYSHNDTAVDSCSVNGKNNTSIMLAFNDTIAAIAVNNYKAVNSRKTGWFLPSMRDLANIYKIKEDINITAKQIWGVASRSLQSGCYWSSTERDASNAWSFNMENGTRNYRFKSGKCNVRPVIKYGY